MAKNVGRHIGQKIGRCIFCGQKGGLTRTLIWPNWLNKILTVPIDRTLTRQWEIPLSPNHSDEHAETIKIQGGFFSQKPFLACDRCNTGWMSDFEPKIKSFAIPLLTSLDQVKISRNQLDILAGWTCMIAMLAEYEKHRRHSCIPKEERRYFKEYLQPPDTWGIFVCSQNCAKWYAHYVIHRKWYKSSISAPEFVSTFVADRPANTQISSFGVGKLFVQTFSSPYLRLFEDFRSVVKSEGLLQIWPKPSPLNPFAKRSTKFPTKLVLDEEAADIMASAFSKRFDILHGAKSVRRYRHT